MSGATVLRGALVLGGLALAAWPAGRVRVGLSQGPKPLPRDPRTGDTFDPLAIDEVTLVDGHLRLFQTGISVGLYRTLFGQFWKAIEPSAPGVVAVEIAPPADGRLVPTAASAAGWLRAQSGAGRAVVAPVGLAFDTVERRFLYALSPAAGALCGAGQRRYAVLCGPRCGPLLDALSTHGPPR